MRIRTLMPLIASTMKRAPWLFICGNSLCRKAPSSSTVIRGSDGSGIRHPPWMSSGSRFHHFYRPFKSYKVPQRLWYSTFGKSRPREEGDGRRIPEKTCGTKSFGSRPPKAALRKRHEHESRAHDDETTQKRPGALHIRLDCLRSCNASGRPGSIGCAGKVENPYDADRETVPRQLSRRQEDRGQRGRKHRRRCRHGKGQVCRRDPGGVRQEPDKEGGCRRQAAWLQRCQGVDVGRRKRR